MAAYQLHHTKTAKATKQLLGSFGWDVLSQSPFSDLAPSNYFHFSAGAHGREKMFKDEKVKG